VTPPYAFRHGSWYRPLAGRPGPSRTAARRGVLELYRGRGR